MMEKKCFMLLVAGSLLCSLSLPSLAAGQLWDLPDNLTIKPHFYGHFQAGQIVKGNLKDNDIKTAGNPDLQHEISHIWTEDAVVELGFDARYGDHLTLGFTLGSKLYFSYPIILLERYTKNMRQDVYLGDLYGQYHFGDPAMPYFLAKMGYFKIKYNPDCRNFGDYLFRTGTYPIWFDMSFDNPWQRVLGFQAQTNLFESLKIDALFISSTVAPAMNWSLAGLVDYDVAGLHFINIGAGVDFAHLFSVYTDNYNSSIGGSLTTPKSANINSRYIDENGDTLWYTFQGTKAMGRISIDPKAFLPFKDVFGKDDLKLYAEADIIGLKSYPDSGITIGDQWQLVAPSYNKIFEKMPIAIGFNVPAFKLLDVLNAEVEWFGARYWNDASLQINYGDRPLPNGVDLWFNDPNQPKKAFWKWSVYAKRSFSDGHFAITGQVGRDHMRLPCAYYTKEMWNELLVTVEDWAWYLKVSWMF